MMSGLLVMMLSSYMHIIDLAKYLYWHINLYWLCKSLGIDNLTSCVNDVQFM